LYSFQREREWLREDLLDVSIPKRGQLVAAAARPFCGSSRTRTESDRFAARFLSQACKSRRHAGAILLKNNPARPFPSAHIKSPVA
jgi:hypothetical protein